MTISPPVQNDTALEITEALKKVLPQYGIRVEPDVFNPNTQGGSRFTDQHSFRNRKDPNNENSTRTRESTWSGYLPASLRASRKNLSFRTDSKAVELIYQTDLPGGQFLFGSQKPKVVGVVYIKENSRYTVFARKQVILSAGIFGSVEFLQYNGIGPSDLLNSLGIPVVSDLPIGRSIQSHQASPMSFVTKKQIKFDADNCGQNAEFMLKTPFAQGDSNDIQVEVLSSVLLDSTDPYVDGINPGYITYTDPALVGKAYPFISLMITNVEPTDRGMINITSKTYGRPVAIDLGWTKDFTAFVGGTEFFKLLHAYKTFRSIFTGDNDFANEWIEKEVIPGPATGSETQDYHDALTTAYRMASIYHMTGGVALGVATDLKGRVKGVDGLTVCDNSLIPHAPNANPTTTMLALCEYVADQIKLRK
eukprot:TRINITY_DN10248_c0_g1_i1.p1 TRINITY_DN10248_c0_g1~~TRINITY_DN10248_c0_g1_i1.p1  ORF type:complete len:421 (-),score=128.77 TRINITY_DN10248_c0_g1_i1:59-1321(-)